MPTPSSLLSAYATLSTSIILLRTIFDEFFPPQLRRYVIEAIRLFWKPKSSKLTLVLEEKDGMAGNHVFEAAEGYLCTMINPDVDHLRITKNVKDKRIKIKFAESEELLDSFNGIALTWKYVREKPQQRHGDADFGRRSFGGSFSPETKYIQLKFDKKYKNIIINDYLPSLIDKFQELENQKKVVKIYNLQTFDDGLEYYKESVNLDHPSTFDTLAMNSKLKKAIIEDLDLFLMRRDFYKKVGKAWKRGYLLYGPPGTGKSSLIAAIANYLKFDIYDLQLTDVRSDSSLRQMILKTSNRSILVIEDIDCSIQLPDRNGIPPSKFSDVKSLHNQQFSLSGLLNFMDGLWSCCGDERIIIFTTNHKERLDPALLRPGRMDMHILMSYLTFDGFKTLAANYLNIHNHHQSFSEIEELINCTKVTPAEVAEELMKSNDVEVVLEGLVKFLIHKKMRNDETKEEINDGDDEVHEDTQANTVSSI